MTMPTTGYITLAEAKAFMYDGTVASTANDGWINTAIVAASRLIDREYGGHFYKTSGAETRAYAPDDYRLIFPDDIVSITTLKTDDNNDGTYETTWATGDYNLMPYNASLKEEPYTAIQVSGNGDYYFPLAVRDLPTLQIVGYFGWPKVPAIVKEATYIQTNRWYTRRSIPIGMAGNSDVGFVRMDKLDPDVKEMIGTLRKYV